MNTVNDDGIEERLRFKTISTILIGFFFTILFGILQYLLPIFIDLDATLLVILLIFFGTSLISSYLLKTPKLFAVNSLLVPLSTLITLFLNGVYPKYALTELLPNLAGETFVLFLLCSFMSVVLITPIIRICSGYETLFSPVVYSYIAEGKADSDFHKRFKKLVMLVGATSFTSYTSKDRDFNAFEFSYGHDKYLTCLCSRRKDTSELDFLVFRMKRDTIIPPEKDNVDFFFSLFDAAAEKLNEQNKIAHIGKEKNPSFLEDIKSLFFLSYTSPVRLPISIPRPRIRSIRSWTEKHTVLVGFIAGIAATVIGALILRYVFGI